MLKQVQHDEMSDVVASPDRRKMLSYTALA